MPRGVIVLKGTHMTYSTLTMTVVLESADYAWP